MSLELAHRFAIDVTRRQQPNRQISLTAPVVVEGAGPQEEVVAEGGGSATMNGSGRLFVCLYKIRLTELNC